MQARAEEALQRAEESAQQEQLLFVAQRQEMEAELGRLRLDCDTKQATLQIQAEQQNLLQAQAEERALLQAQAEEALQRAEDNAQQEQTLLRGQRRELEDGLAQAVQALHDAQAEAQAEKAARLVAEDYIWTLRTREEARLQHESRLAEEAELKAIGVSAAVSIGEARHARSLAEEELEANPSAQALEAVAGAENCVQAEQLLATDAMLHRLRVSLKAAQAEEARSSSADQGACPSREVQIPYFSQLVPLSRSRSFYHSPCSSVLLFWLHKHTSVHLCNARHLSRWKSFSSV